LLEQKGDKIHIEEMNGEKGKANFTCSVEGQECAVKDDGHAETATMYFNGSRLVQIRERGQETLKQRLTLSADGKTMTVETVPLSSGQRSETTSFSRQQR
jgi:hypothetical protein